MNERVRSSSGGVPPVGETQIMVPAMNDVRDAGT